LVYFCGFFLKLIKFFKALFLNLAENYKIIIQILNIMKEDEHYICSACGGISDVPGNCQTKGCSKYQQALDECECGNPAIHTDSGENGGGCCGKQGCTDCGR